MRIVDALADLLLGAQCPGCDAPCWGVCERCRPLLLHNPHEVRRVTGMRVVAANPYRPVLETAIPRFKDDGALHLERPLGERLALAVAAVGAPTGSVLVPVPSRPASVRARGFDHAARLADFAARRLGFAVRKVVNRKSSGRDQLGLDARSRAANLAHTMRARNPGRPVVIVDDVVTTGASLGETRRALLSAGANVVGAAVIGDVDDVP